MLNYLLVKKAILAGSLSGIILGLFLKGIELTTKIKVYTLLLNVDYIPVINTIMWPEIIEFLFHLIVSILLCLLILLFIKYKNYPPYKIPKLTITICIVLGILLFPSTDLSTKTPDVTSIRALTFWLIGHVIYGYSLGLLLRQKNF